MPLNLVDQTVMIEQVVVRNNYYVTTIVIVSGVQEVVENPAVN